MSRDVDAISAHLVEPPPRPTAVNPALPQALDAVIARGMSKDSSRRYPSAGDLAAAASAAATGSSAPRREQSVAAGAAAPAATEAPRRRRTVPMIAVGMLLLAAAVLLATRDGATDHPVDGDAGPAAGRPLPVDGTPNHIAIAGGAIWTSTTAGGRLVRTDPAGKGSKGRPAPADLGGGEFPALTAGGGSLWQLQGFARGGGVTKVDPVTGSAQGRVALGGATAAFAGDRRLWVTTRRNRRGRLAVVDSGATRITGTAPAGADPAAVVRAGDAIWVADRGSDRVLRFDPASLELRSRVAVGDGPAVLAGGADVLWVGNLAERTLTRVDVTTAEVTGAPVSLGKEIQALARSPQTLWVAAADSTVTPLDPRTGEVLGPSVQVDDAPLALAADGEGVWVASAGEQTIQRLER